MRPSSTSRSRHSLLASTIVLATILTPPSSLAQSLREPVQILRQSRIPKAKDHRFYGTIKVTVDATDIAHKLFTVHEEIPVQRAGPLTLLYPRWENASHGPSVTVTDLAGFTVQADGHALAWRRNPIEPHAFLLDVPMGMKAIELSYQIVVGADEMSPDLVVVPWQRLTLYPAGWYTRNLSVTPTLKVPTGLQTISALETSGSTDGYERFATISLETLLDSPAYAARYVSQIPLEAAGSGVTFTLMATRPTDLTLPPDRLGELRHMVTQTRSIFGPTPFRTYDFLARMGDDASTGGTEHRRSSEISIPSNYFRDWPKQLGNRDIIAHEFVHAWNGLYRTPADLWAPTPNVPQGGSLLWVYEGQTEFWGRVLATRAGLRSNDETLDQLALDAAEMTNRPGRAWRSLSDDVNYPSFMLHQRVPWRDWQRRRDYYTEGVLLWLDVEARLRDRSRGRFGLDDFARSFFAGASDSAPTRTYTFDDICAVLNQLAPGDWRAFLQGWLDGHDELNTSEGLERLGWQLIYTDTPTEAFQQNEEELGGSDLSYSLGMVVADNGTIRSVAWNSPAFQAGLAPGVRITMVSAAPYSRKRLLDAVRQAARAPIQLTVEQDGKQTDRSVDYRGSLRYPRLERIAGRPDRLSSLLAPR